MPHVSVDQVINAGIEATWSTVRSVSDYPTYMDNVRSIDVIADEGSERTIGWSVVLKGSIVEWSERELIDDQDHRIDFAQVDGDLDRFDGFWHVTEIDADRTRVVLEIDFEIGIPLLAQMLDPVAERALRDSSEQMLRSVESQVAAS